MAVINKSCRKENSPLNKGGVGVANGGIFKALIINKSPSRLASTAPLLRGLILTCCIFSLSLPFAPPLYAATPSSLEQSLGWINDPNNTICHGYYAEAPLLSGKHTLTADRATFYLNAPNTLEGHVHFKDEGREAKADKAVIITDHKTNKIKELHLEGNVLIHQFGIITVASSASLNVMGKTGSIEDATFRYQSYGQEVQSVYNSQGQLTTLKMEGTNYRGTADKIVRNKEQQIILYDTQMTSCGPYSNAWYIDAEKLVLDKSTGMGTAYNSILSVQGVPVAYLPYLRFPIDNARRSGFLIPNIQNSSSGLTVDIPYYFNLAPNYDLLFTPTYYQNRGFQYNNLFRYLTPMSQGQVYLSGLAYDSYFDTFKANSIGPDVYPNSGPEKNLLATESDSRYQLAWIDNTQYNPYLSSAIDIDYVTDSYYIQDFGDAPFIAGNTALPNQFLPSNQLLQSAILNYDTENLSLSAELQNYQTLHLVNLPGAQDQYATLPSLQLTRSFNDSFLGLDYDFSTSVTNFQHPLFEGNYPTTLLPVTGVRYHGMPSISDDMQAVYGYLKPTVTYNQIIYDLSSPVLTQGQTQSMSVGIPTYDIDSGLYFDRPLRALGGDYTQTFEPRLFYLNTPYINQDNLPLFDTTLNTITTYDDLFQTNRFLGGDRVGDANQITYGATTRFIDNNTGLDVLDFSLGQIAYFENRQVQAVAVTVGAPPTPLPQSATEDFSPIVGEVNWQFRQFWTATTNVAYDMIQKAIESENTSVGYNFDNNHIFNVGYGFLQGGDPLPNIPVNSPQNNLQQISVSGAWPLSPAWHVLGALNYNISHGYDQTYLYGLEYDSCCTAIRFVDTKTYIGVQPDGITPAYDSVFYVQFAFRGLSSVGNGSAANMLNTNIPNFNDEFGVQSFLNAPF